VYVVDTGNQRIQKFSTDGDLIGTFGSSGLGEGQFLTATGIDIDGDGNVYITDKGNKKIEKFDADGKFVKSFPFHSSNYNFTPEAIAVDSTGEMFIVNSANDRILHLSQDSNLNLNVFDQIGPYTDSFEIVTDIVIGTNGELLVIDSAKHKIQSFETSFYTEPLIAEFVKPAEVVEEKPFDQTKPIIVAPISLEVEASDFLTSVSIGDATAFDDSGIKTIINNSPESFGPGVTTIMWIAFDNVGHSASTTQRITVTTCGNPYFDYNLIEGTQGDDVIQGTDGDDLIFGLAGNDLISGGLGDDCIFGGYGDDIVSGGDGDDTLKGNSGNDILKGQSGIDVIYANSGSDVIDGGANSDRCYVDSRNDLILNCE
jgi:Ca2+-binding RTX toxin-like protein